MTWEAHQAVGFFGFTPPGRDETAWQPRWRATVDPDAAQEAAGPLLSAFWKWMRWPDAQPFTGGVLDAWPAREADGLAFARREWRAVQEYLTSLEARRG